MPTFYWSICRYLVVLRPRFVSNCRFGVVSARSRVFHDVLSHSLRVYSIHIFVVALQYISRFHLTFPYSAFRNDLCVTGGVGRR
jgi:hypothetical protein